MLRIDDIIRSLIKIKNNVRPEPWGTTELIQKEVDECPFKTIFTSRFDKIESFKNFAKNTITFQQLRKTSMPNSVKGL